MLTRSKQNTPGNQKINKPSVVGYFFGKHAGKGRVTERRHRHASSVACVRHSGGGKPTTADKRRVNGARARASPTRAREHEGGRTRASERAWCTHAHVQVRRRRRRCAVVGKSHPACQRRACLQPILADHRQTGLNRRGRGRAKNIAILFV